MVFYGIVCRCMELYAIVWYGNGYYGMVTITIGMVGGAGGWQWHAGGVTAHFSCPPSLSICKTG